MNYIVIDLEFNQAYDFDSGVKTQRNISCPFEIIQIGAVKLNDSLKVVDTGNFFINPKLYPRIHPYVEKITGLTDEMLKDKPTFLESFNEMLKFIGEEEYIFGVWGNHDINLLFRNIKHYGLDEEALSKDYINIQMLASNHLKKPNGMSIGLQNAVESFGLTVDLPFHDALNDALYTAKVFEVVKTDDMIIQSFNSGVLQKTRQPETINLNRLFRAVEKEYGRRLSKKEKSVAKKIYLMGRSKQFDFNNRS